MNTALQNYSVHALSGVLNTLMENNRVIHYAPENARDKYMFQAGQQDMLAQLKRLVEAVNARKD